MRGETMVILNRGRAPKELLAAMVALLFCIVPATASFAIVVDLPDIDGIGYFADTSTGYTWMDLDRFLVSSGPMIHREDVVAALAGTGFGIATYDQVTELYASVAETPYGEGIGATLPTSVDGTPPYIYDIYAGRCDGSVDTDAGIAFVYYHIADASLFPQYPSSFWQMRSGVYFPGGWWVVNTNPIPEPSILLLLGTGLLGLAGYGRGRDSRC